MQAVPRLKKVGHFKHVPSSAQTRSFRSNPPVDTQASQPLFPSLAASIIVRHDRLPPGSTTGRTALDRVFTTSLKMQILTIRIYIFIHRRTLFESVSRVRLL